MRNFKTILFLLLVTAATVGCVNDTPDRVEVTDQNRLVIGDSVPGMESVGAMTFAPDNSLLIADYQSGSVFAFDVPRGRGPLLFVPFNILDVDVQIAALLGTSVDQIDFKDMVVHPVNHSAYLSLMVGDGASAQPVVLNVTHKGVISLVDLASIPFTSITIDQLPDDGAVYGNNISLRSLSITDLDLYDGELFVSGLSNGEMSSTIRRMAYPFDGSVSTTSTEIYHSSNDQIETQAPIRSQTIIETENGPILLAGYTGTPLVTFPLSDLQDGAHVQGKTVADLGYGSTPLDLLPYSEFGTSKVIVTSTGYNALSFETDQIVTAEALSSMVSQGEIEGVEPFSTAMTSISQISDLDFAHLLMLRTNKDSDNLDLVSTVKSIWFRLSDFQSEYDSVGYSYPDDGSQRIIKLFHNVFRLNEGHRDEVVFP